jgi:hypothetical protein
LFFAQLSKKKLNIHIALVIRHLKIVIDRKLLKVNMTFQVF